MALCINVKEGDEVIIAGNVRIVIKKCGYHRMSVDVHADRSIPIVHNKSSESEEGRREAEAILNRRKRNPSQT